MAGRLPGVGLPQRKRSSENNNHHNHRYYEHHHATHRALYLTRDSSLDAPPPLPPSPPSLELDETTLKARQRLQKKLGHFFSSTRESENPKKEGKVVREISSSIQQGRRDAAGGIGRKLLASSWLLRRPNKKDQRKVCAVCLEDLQQEQQEVMNLPCSHKYHSHCLLPWLASHPHCPYCRTPILVHHK